PLARMALAGARLLRTAVTGRSGAAIFADGIVRRPTGFAGVALLVPDPADVRADVAEDDRPRLKFAHPLPGVRPVIVGAAVDGPRFSRAAIVAVAAVGAVVPHLEDWPVAR